MKVVNLLLCDVDMLGQEPGAVRWQEQLFHRGYDHEGTRHRLQAKEPRFKSQGEIPHGIRWSY
jgi:hypothetical protein